MRRTLPAVTLFLLTLACAPGGAADRDFDSADALLTAMHDRYADDWYRTLSFKQRVIRTSPEGVQQPPEVWTEYAALPGRLRIDLADGYSGGGVIYRGDSLYVVEAGELASAEATRNPLMILGFDVHTQPPERTIDVLRQEGFDLAKLRADTFEGRPVWVVGADSGDLHSNQFWVDAERLLFVRLLQPFPQATDRTLEFVFADYQPLAGGWIAPLVLFRLDGREFMREEYFDMVADPSLPEATFDPSRWGPLPPTTPPVPE